MTRMIRNKEVLENLPPTSTPVIPYGDFDALEHDGDTYRECKANSLKKPA